MTDSLSVLKTRPQIPSIDGYQFCTQSNSQKEKLITIREKRKTRTYTRRE